tara:strand:- start:178878 stop:179309 length:432 start_codon:yes stop_codon:yes gene_type:complete
VFCDDVRYEVSNKFSLIGIYQENMVFHANPPVLVPKLCTSFWLLSDIDDPIKHFCARVLLTSSGVDDVELVRYEFAEMPPLPTDKDDARKSILRGTLAFGPFAIESVGYIEVWCETERDDIRAARLRVEFESSDQPLETQVET